MSKFMSLLLCGSALTFTAGAAHAQSAAAPAAGGQHQLEEVVVTARKREESLQRVPVAVAVVSAQALKNNLASDLQKVGELAPQVSLATAGSGTGAVITVRGVSSASNDAGLDQSVALEVDGVPMSRGRIISAAIFDMASVQVLQGPQALFFGKNSPGGVISLRSVDPGNEVSGYATVGYEFKADEKFFEGAVGGPLTDTLKARVAVRLDKIKGWIKNTATPIPYPLDPGVVTPGATQGKRGPGGHDYAGRLTLLWEPDNTFDARFKLFLDSQTRNGNTTEPFCIGGQTQPYILGNIPLPGEDCDKNMVKSHSAIPAKYAQNFPYGNGGVPYFISKFGLGSLALNKRFDNFSIASTTGYYRQMTQQAYSADWSPYATIWASSKESYKLFTQEVRANTDLDGPVNVMVGGYFEHFKRPFFNAPDLFHTFNSAANNYTVTNLLSNTTGTYYSAFAQLRWNIMPDLELAGGARWSHDKKRLSLVNLGSAPVGTGAAILKGPLSASYSDNNVSPEVTLTWHPTPDQTLYGAWKNGYKAGGLSNAFLVFAGTTPSSLEFQPEKVKGFEAGYKATMLDRRVRFDLTAYRYNYNNLQVVAYNAQTISFVLQNAASARIQGVQGSGEWLVTDDLTLRGNFGYNSAKYRRFDTAPCYVQQTVAEGCIAAAGGVPAHQNLSGRHLIRAPKLTFMGGFDYKLRLMEGWATNLSAQASHTSSYETATDQAPGGHQKGYWLLNAALRTGPEDGHWEVALIGRNLTNSYYTQETIGWSGSSVKTQYVGNFSRPREVVLEGTVRW
jgi:outer membrane receptor protein involved in Fe transport